MAFKLQYELSEGKETKLSAITQVDTYAEALVVAKEKAARLLDAKWVTTVMDGCNAYMIFVEHTYKGRLNIEQIL